MLKNLQEIWRCIVIKLKDILKEDFDKQGANSYWEKFKKSVNETGDYFYDYMNFIEDSPGYPSTKEGKEMAKADKAFYKAFQVMDKIHKNKVMKRK